MSTHNTPSGNASGDMDVWDLSPRGRAYSDSAIRALAKRLAQRPDIVSFAGGMPAPETFPLEAFARAFEEVLRRDGGAALQYGPTDGYAPLREWIAARLSTPGARIDAGQVLLTTGAQQGLDLVGKVLLDAGDTVAVETPTYLGALQSLSQYFPRYVEVPCDDEGIDAAALGTTLAATGRPCKFLYTIPTFQNPSGRTLSLARRQSLVEACRSARLPIVEDDPYGELDYRGQQHTSLLSLDASRVVYLGSFSKVLSPGIRLGYVVAPPAVYRRLEQAKQASDLHSSTVLQRVVFEIIRNGFLDGHLQASRALYRRHAEALDASLRKHLSGHAQCRMPDGGMFLWLRLSGGLDAQALLDKAVDAGVAFVPGAPFFATAPDHATLRLCFSTVGPAAIERGVATLGQVVRDALKAG
jgi:2-aminoadipate transaminase